MHDLKETNAVANALFVAVGVPLGCLVLTAFSVVPLLIMLKLTKSSTKAYLKITGTIVLVALVSGFGLRYKQRMCVK